VNKTELINAISDRYEGNRKAAAHALESVLDTIQREVAKGEKVAITGFGSFEKRVREARWVRNPRTGDKVKAKKTSVPKFTPGAELKAVVSGAKKLPKLTLSSVKSTAAKATGKAAAPAKKAPAKKAAAKKAPAKKAAAKKAPAKKAPAKKAAAKKAPAKRAAKKA
jgi:DNA-binding protein HU-beta